MPHHPIPVIDLFAGPGGLSEGFSSLGTASGARFEVALSVEKDAAAHQTLELRSFVRAFGKARPDAYYEFLSGHIDRNALFTDRRFRDQVKKAKGEAWHYTLSEETHRAVSRRVKEAVRKRDTWVLIGGPPCQAYSLMGRARMRSSNPKRFEKDERHFLYKEYLRILADHMPPVFVMENVKGILSSTVHGRLIFQQILDDLSRPNGGSLRYRVTSLSHEQNISQDSPEEYVIRCEQYGVPQARHRVILCGVREDLIGRPGQLVQSEVCPGVRDALSDLPPIRSRISKEEDSHRAWIGILREARQLLAGRAGTSYRDVCRTMNASMARARSLNGAGGPFVSYGAVRGRPSSVVKRLLEWYRDPNLEGVTGHESRFHMRSDLHRYFFAASFALARGNVSPKLRDFPRFLLPKHRNARKMSTDTPFVDRFRVQVFGGPSTTVTSHIAKDGHYYIHPDPAQCRSLTLREAARLQTFPDNYHFAGTRTQQLSQVGNAVPPLLARQIAETIGRFL